MSLKAFGFFSKINKKSKKKKSNTLKHYKAINLNITHYDKHTGFLSSNRLAEKKTFKEICKEEELCQKCLHQNVTVGQ